MRVLVVGGGGREHALVWKLAQSPVLSALFAAPGNPGTARLATNLAIGADDVAGLVAAAMAHAVDLVVPGPEAPLAAGLADALEAAGIACFGPSRAASRLEASKRFTKELCDEADIPTARWAAFTETDAALAYLARQSVPVVVKADGLAAGKGVVVAASQAEAAAAVGAMLEGGLHGESGAEIVIEECLTGREISVFALCDGETALYCGAAADHKRVGEGDTGPNTGGMGALAPPPLASEAVIEAAMDRIVRPALASMARRGTPFRGVLFAGLMLTENGPKLIEFNVRFGDPECEALLPLLESDLLPLMAAGARGSLDAGTVLAWRDAASVTVVLAARGYPGAHARGAPIDLGAAPGLMDVQIFHAGTKEEGGRLVASGGRVLAVTATGANLAAARERAYAAIDTIDFPGGFCRRDIGDGGKRRCRRPQA